MTAAEPPALPFVSPIFGDNMVLQRGKANKIWGWSTPGARIRVEVGGHAGQAVAGPDGYWQAEFQPPATGGPYTLAVDGPQHVEFHEVLVGDVWLCGGQSNMEMGLSQARNGAEEIQAAHHPEIRLYIVAQRAAYATVAVPRGSWKICSPQTIAEGGWGGFSAVAYFFARRVQQDTHVPIGLVQDCVGGTPAETWTSRETLHQLKDYEASLAEFDRLKTNGGTEYGNYIMPWLDTYDVGAKSNSWAGVSFNDSSWKAVQLPSGFADLGVGDVPSLCWFRKTITLPDPLPVGNANIYLGPIETMDTTYINGKWVGASGWPEFSRAYEVKRELLQPGTNVITVRVFKGKPQGGFLGRADAFRLVLGDGTVVPLDGSWQGKISVDARPPHPLPFGFENWPVMPAVLYQGMLQPIAPLALSGAIWYQGEANTGRAYLYRNLLTAMIGDWRKLFGQGNFPFYIATVSGFMPRQSQPGDSAWAELREAQIQAAGSVPNSAVAVTIDVGNADNVHPPDKREVGERLAICALTQYYGAKYPYQGPTVSGVEFIAGAIKLHFAHTEGGLRAKNDRLEDFSIAGEDHKWHWANAIIEADAVIVSTPTVPKPQAVRYAWQSNPNATLYNGAGFPAPPFRTDHWPGITAPKKAK